TERGWGKTGPPTSQTLLLPLLTHWEEKGGRDATPALSPPLPHPQTLLASVYWQYAQILVLANRHITEVSGSYLDVWPSGALDPWGGVTFRFASYYGDHMVLQKKPAGAVVWGYGESGANVTLSLSKDSKVIMKKMAQVEEHSETWKVVLAPMDHGGPYSVMAEQHSREEPKNLTLRDIYFGDVWLCSGQSNMEMTVSQILNASKELSEASLYPYIRVFTAALIQSEVELQDLAKIDLEWSIPTAENLGHGNFSYFSAVCWLFGRHLYEMLQYPIGLVESSWGGTCIEAWSSRRALHECGLKGDARRFLLPTLLSGPDMPSVLWNAMIHPLLNMSLTGVIWYQGETNAFINTDLYNCTFPALLTDWRKAFHAGSDGQTQPLFPFGFVQ
ncbi:unnamed protein product, partial [Caretta caretta]